MQKLPSGFWVPDGSYGTRFFDTLTDDGLPAAGFDRVQACIEACGKRRKIAVDGGAYVGVWSLHLAKRFRRVFAYEPASDNFECLQRNTAALRKRVQLREAALSSTTGWMEWEQRSKPYAGRVRAATGNHGFLGRKLDDENLPRLDLLKLDVEGHEYDALLGARETIIRCKPVVLIEEKLDRERRATQLLIELGMRVSWRKRYDYLFTW